MRRPNRPDDPTKPDVPGDAGDPLAGYRVSFGDHEAAFALFAQGYREQMRGDLGAATRLYRSSLAHHPTAEAWTFLGWAFSFAGRIDEAISCCLRAIEVDPSFGNPYNDIGAYLMARGRDEEALPWFERAAAAARYEPRQFPWCNAGIALERLGRWDEARRAFRRALALDPGYALALAHKRRLDGLYN